MSLVDEIIAYWDGPAAARRSYPEHRGKWPDDDHVSILQRLCRGFVCDVGCGNGRAAEAFGAERYVGIDINAAAVQAAIAQHRNHTFKVIGYREAYPPADTYLFHTTLMHVPDGELDAVLLRARANAPCHAVIFESMMPEYRGGKFNFQRDVTAYVQAMGRCGFIGLVLDEYPTKYQVGGKGRPELVRRFLTGVAR